MILIVDSGSTKTHWCLTDNGEIQKELFTKGMNPFFQCPEELSFEVTKMKLAMKNFSIDAIYFYGAGCAYGKERIVRDAFQKEMDVPIEIHSDLVGAARSLCGRTEGIACILGTGSNSCAYNGKQIYCNIPSLGFILGDEGSGAALGKRFFGDLLKDQLPKSVVDSFLQMYDLRMDDVLECVYKKPFPNRFLAKFSPFIAKHIHVPEIENLVKANFTDFFRRNVMQYEYTKLPIHFVGSIAAYYEKQLRSSAEELRLSIETIVQSPMNGLIKYHG